jgi:hypothetical protein
MATSAAARTIQSSAAGKSCAAARISAAPSKPPSPPDAAGRVPRACQHQRQRGADEGHGQREHDGKTPPRGERREAFVFFVHVDEIACRIPQAPREHIEQRQQQNAGQTEEQENALCRPGTGQAHPVLDRAARGRAARRVGLGIGRERKGQRNHRGKQQGRADQLRAAAKLRLRMARQSAPFAPPCCGETSARLAMKPVPSRHASCARLGMASRIDGKAKPEDPGESRSSAGFRPRPSMAAQPHTGRRAARRLRHAAERNDRQRRAAASRQEPDRTEHRRTGVRAVGKTGESRIAVAPARGPRRRFRRANGRSRGDGPPGWPRRVRRRPVRCAIRRAASRALIACRDDLALRALHKGGEAPRTARGAGQAGDDSAGTPAHCRVEGGKWRIRGVRRCARRSARGSGGQDHAG